MRKKQFILLLLFGVVVACQNQPGLNSEKSVEEITSAEAISNADIVRNPISAQTPEDTVNIAKLSFAEEVYDFGEVQEGAIVKHTYHFTNTGKMPLIISNARSTCGCTVPSWPEEPIAPGGKGKIEVEFNTKGKTEQQSKPITITANTYPASTRIFLKGYVKSDQAGPNS